jgi:hypothetical protein
MEDERIDIEEQIARCRRLASLLTDDEMRTALQELADDYEAELRHRRRSRNGRNSFMLRDAG